MKLHILYILLLFSLTSCNGRIKENHQNNTLVSWPVTAGKTIEGKVIRISDGDTFSLIFDNGFDVKVRLNGIDSPERKQAFSKKAKQALSALIFDKVVTVAYKKKDRYGRVLGEVYVDGINVNHEMVRRGMAWHFTRYSDDKDLARLEQEARKNKVGLWSDPNAVAPWEFRGN